MFHTDRKRIRHGQYTDPSHDTENLKEVRAEFDRCGISVSGWAVRHGIPRNIVSGVLQGRLKGKRGHAHNAAVLLGLKDGVVNREEAHEPDLCEALPAREG